MIEPQPERLTQADILSKSVTALWRDAPAWRGLAVATVLFSTATATVPFVLSSSAPGTAPDPASSRAVTSSSEPMKPSCTLMAGLWSGGKGDVIGFLTKQQAESVLANTQTRLAAAINPNYLTNLRAVVEIKGPSGARHVVALVPLSRTVNKGDHVIFGGGHRDMSLPCNYIPNLISSVTPASGDAP